MCAVRDASRHDETTDRQEFDALFSGSYRRVFSLAYRMLGNTCEAEDVTQEVFLRAWHHFSHYDRAYRVESWLYRILVNRVIDHRRRWKHAKTFSLDALRDIEPDGSPVTFEIPDTSADPEKLVLSREMDEAIRKALLSLPYHYRVVVLLAGIHGCSYQEI